MCLYLCMCVYICVWTSCVLCVLSTQRYIWWTSTICSLQTWIPLPANVCLSCKANTWRAFAEEDSQVTKQSWLTHAQDQLWKIRHPYFCPYGANKCPTYSYLLLCRPYLGFSWQCDCLKWSPAHCCLLYLSVIGYNVPNQIKSVKYPCSGIQLLVMSSISTKTQVHTGCVLKRWYNVCLKAHQILTA